MLILTRYMPTANVAPYCKACNRNSCLVLLGSSGRIEVRQLAQGAHGPVPPLTMPLGPSVDLTRSAIATAPTKLACEQDADVHASSHEPRAHAPLGPTPSYCAVQQPHASMLMQAGAAIRTMSVAI